MLAASVVIVGKNYDVPAVQIFRMRLAPLPDDDGTLLFQSVRFDPKEFRQRRPKDGGGWEWKVKGCKQVPYRLPELLAADPGQLVFVVEGEKDVDRARAQGLVATCNAGGADPNSKPDANEDDEDEGFVKTIADRICTNNNFARDAGGKLYRYRDGAYRSKAETYIRAEVKRLCVELEETARWSTRFAEEVVGWIGVDAPELWERPPVEIVNVTNGLLRLADCQLLPHSTDFLSSVQLPVKFEPQATCPAIDTFVDEVFPADATDLAYEVPAWLMTPDTSIQKAVLLQGLGGNGKSTYLEMLKSFLGKQNCVGLSLHKLESNRFAVARLNGMLANICPDLPTEHLSGTSMFKALTGGDFGLEGEHKFRDGFSFDPFCRLVFSANSWPRSSDASEAFFDRWLVVPFDARFRGTAREMTRKELDARLSAPNELSGLLNKAVAAWRSIQDRGGKLSESESVRAAWAEFHAMTDPLSVWLEQFTVDDPQAMVPRQVLRAAYGAACERAGRSPMTERAFAFALAKARPQVESAQRTINRRRPWCYIGIGLRGDDLTTARDAQHAQDDPSLFLTHAHEEMEDRHRAEKECEQVIQVEAHPKQAVQPMQTGNGRGCPKCGHSEFVDVPIHGGQSARRDCAKCGRTVGFVKWEMAVDNEEVRPSTPAP